MSSARLLVPLPLQVLPITQRWPGTDVTITAAASPESEVVAGFL